MISEHHDGLHDIMHALSLATILGAIAGWLPHIATALAIAWYLVRLYENATVRKLGRWLRRVVLRRKD